MTTRIIPTEPTLQAYSVSTELNAATYGIDIRFNRRDNKPRMSISNGGAPQVSGVPVSTELDLLTLHTYNPNVPQGVMRAADTDQLFTEPTPENFGQTVLLVYDEP